MLGNAITLSVLALTSVTSAFVQGDCVKKDAGLKWLAGKINKSSAISCRGQPLQLFNQGRYWGTQYGKNASVVVFPSTKEDVAFAVQAASKTKLGKEFAFVAGAHGQTNASTATGYIIDLSWLNSTKVLKNVKVGDVTIPEAVAYQGGAKWDDIQGATAGSNYTAVGARVGSVGAGGFSTGGGIGFLAGAYGYASDRLEAVEVVLMNGKIVNATKTNQYKDLFWALQGGGGQFGIVTTFYQKAAPEPQVCDVSFYVVSQTDLNRARQRTVTFFNTNDDPFSLMYFAAGFFPSDLGNGSFGLNTLLVTLRFDDPTNPNQKSTNATFSRIIDGLNITATRSLSIPYRYMTQSINNFFPYSFRRGFFGPQTQNITVDYLANGTNILNKYVSDMAAAGDVPASSFWALQYMHPGLNGNLPRKDSDTAWPHARAGHQTLFSPAWRKAEDDPIMKLANGQLNQLTWGQQARFGERIYDYPNYISPGVKAKRVWGGNVKRLIAVKEKYDPDCRIHQGRVFATKACIKGGWANLFGDR
ncbi:hypothetical protein BDZ85DRAFT_17790 [Elsinoe ampelina]|uniref:FAD-binding PCMH-type domain-containing protein n=1 Tax=Elsinoe ampelina TaxID=302913 RepID=A0A6A6G6V8_9PEZI|nr:hypothetical protein BDZ85DRAFT_17790 [Elsinoe ampelina]